MRIKHAALAAGLLFACVFTGAAFGQVKMEVGNYPTAGPLTGSERMLSDQAGVTVDVLPSQIATYLATSGAIFSFLPSPLVSGYCLSNNGTVLEWVPCSSGGSGVTSVGLSMPSGFTVSGSPVTSSGTLSVTTTLSGLLKGNGSGFTTGVASDIVGLFSGCSGTAYLGADGACHAASGSGTVTSIGLTGPSWLAFSGSPVTTSGNIAISGATGLTTHFVLGTGTTGTLGLEALTAADLPSSITSNTSGNAATATALSTTGGNGTFWGVQGGVQGYYTPAGGSLPSCTINQLLYYAATGTTGTCLTLGTNLSISSGTLNATAGGGGVSSFSGDGALLSNVASTGGVTATLANTGVGYGVWGNTGAASGAPGYHALSAYPLAAFPSGLATYPGAGIPVSTGSAWNTSITPGTGVTTALGVNVGSAGSFVTNGGTLGTPSSGVATNLTGTASGLNIGGNAATATALSTTGGNGTFWGVSGGVQGYYTPAGGGNVSNTGTPTAGQFAEWTSSTVIGGQTLGGDCTLSTATITCTKTSGTSFGALSTATPGTGVATALGVNVGTAGSVVVNGGALGTPSSGVATNLTGTASALNIGGTAANITATSNGTLTTLSALSLPLGQVSGLGTGVATFLATPSSANFAAAVTGETGTGALVFGTSPTFSTGVTLGFLTGLTQCLHVNTSGLISGTGSDCGSGGSTAFSALTSGINTGAAMQVGTGASLAPTGTGTLSANELNGATVPVSALVLGSNGSAQPVSATAGNVLSLINGQTCNAQVGTTYTFVIGDANNCVTMSNASANTITIPANASVAFPIGTTLTVVQINTGTTTLQGAGTPVTLQSAKYGSSTSQTYAFAAEYDCISIQKTATDTWFVSSCSYNPGSGGGMVYPGAGIPNSTGSAWGTSYTTSGSGTVVPLTNSAVLTTPAIAGSSTGTTTIASANASATNYTATLPANTGTIPELNLAQTFTADQTFNGRIISNYAGTSNSPAVKLFGVPFVGTGTTSVPIMYLDPSATAPTTFSTAGTYFGINAGSGFTGNLLDFHINGGASVASLDYQGNLTVASCTGCGSGGSGLSGMTAGQVPIAATATTVTSSKALAGSGTGITTGPTTSVSGDVVTYTGTAGQTQDSGTLLSNLLTSGGALGTPSSGSAANLTGLPVGGIASIGADTLVANATGSSASPTAVSVSAFQMALLQASTTFTITPTGCTPSAHTGGATSGTITLASGPCTSIILTMNGATGLTAPNGWHCNVGDRTLQNAGTWFGEWPESSSTTTTATIGIPSAAGATDVISFNCTGY